MPNEHEPIDARVVDGVAQADTPSDLPPAATVPPRILGNWGCLLFPSAIGITSLVLGLWLISGWDKLSPLAALCAVLLTMFGVAVISIIAAGILLLLRLRRLMRDLKRDARNVAEAISQVANLNTQPHVRVDDATAPADADDAIATDPAALPEAPPEFPDASETPENKPPT